MKTFEAWWSEAESRINPESCESFIDKWLEEIAKKAWDAAIDNCNLVSDAIRKSAFTGEEVLEILDNLQRTLERTRFPKAFFLKAVFKIMKTMPTVENMMNVANKDEGK